MIKKIIAIAVCLALLITSVQPVFAKDFSVRELPVPGSMVGLTNPFVPLTLSALPFLLQIRVTPAKRTSSDVKMHQKSYHFGFALLPAYGSTQNLFNHSRIINI